MVQLTLASAVGEDVARLTLVTIITGRARGAQTLARIGVAPELRVAVACYNGRNWYKSLNL